MPSDLPSIPVITAISHPRLMAMGSGFVLVMTALLLIRNFIPHVLGL